MRNKFNQIPNPKHKFVATINPLAAQQIAAKLQQGFALHNTGQLEQARILYEEILKLDPKHFDALQLSGTIAAQTKQWDKAIRLLTEALKINTTNASVYVNLGLVLNEFKRFEEALKSFDRAIKLNFKYIEAYHKRGLVLIELKRFEEALKSFDRAIDLKPDYAEAYTNRGIVLNEFKRFGEALSSYDKAIELRPDYAEAYTNRGNVLKELNRLEEALTSYDRAIQFKLNFPEAYYNRGIVLFELKRLEEALTSYNGAIEFKRDYAEAYSNRGIVLNELNHLEEALASYDKAINLRPDYVEAYTNRGNVLKELKRLDEALISYDKAIELKPDYAEVYTNRGNVLKELKRLDEALTSYDKAIKLKPEYEYLLGMQLEAKMLLCDWQNFRINIEKLFFRINADEKSSTSFPVMALTDSLSIQHRVSAIWIKDNHPSNPSLGKIPRYEKKNKIRVGYYSADFHNHATAYLMAELFERHDKNNFELIAFSFGQEIKDEMHQRLFLAFDQFIDVRLKSDKEIALMSREMRVDIAVDLKGFTKDARVGIFSYRAAPIQVNYIGYPGTMAAEYIDYIVADPTLIPIESQQHYSEKVVYLPNSYQVNDRQRAIAEKVFTKVELGLPNDGFVFCCFNNNYKITPHTFDGWVKILKAAEGSVLWLLEDNPTAKLNLRKEALTRGLDPNRLVFAKRMNLPEHLARHSVADLFIDTLPCNAHTTASDALWAGLPVLTCMGESFASRVAASLLNAIELPELITTTQEQYESTAIELAANPAKLKSIKDKLERNRLITPLFDTLRYSKHIETAFTQMYERYQADLPPDHIYI